MNLCHQFKWHRSEHLWTATQWLDQAQKPGSSSTFCSLDLCPLPALLLLPNASHLTLPHLLPIAFKTGHNLPLSRACEAGATSCISLIQVSQACFMAHLRHLAPKCALSIEPLDFHRVKLSFSKVHAQYPPPPRLII